jgi:hypothetical protein
MLPIGSVGIAFCMCLLGYRSAAHCGREKE